MLGDTHLEYSRWLCAWSGAQVGPPQRATTQGQTLEVERKKDNGEKKKTKKKKEQESMWQEGERTTTEASRGDRRASTASEERLESGG